MSLSWDDDDASSDDPGWRTRLGAWFAPNPAELTGLAVLVVGALLLTGVLWVQAGSRPTSFGPIDDVAVDGAAHEVDATLGAGARDIGARMDATGTADGPAPGIDGAAADAGAHEVVDARGVDDAASVGTTGSVVVHVTGAVRTTGLVTLPAGARVGDVVVAAGGARDDALVERVNLARVVVDGEHVHLPAEGDDPTTLPPIGGAPSRGGFASGGSGGEGEGLDGAGPIHLNRASAAELETLPGVGPARAAAIVTHRQQQGPFTTPGDLRAVSGIGEATFQRLAPLITVE